MTIRWILFPIFLFVAFDLGSAQTSQSDSQTFHAILNEIRAIHDEVKTTEATQILLTELEMQQGVVNRATQRVDDMQAKLSEVKAEQRYTAQELARAKENLDQATDQQQIKDISGKIESLKNDASGLNNAEQERSTNLQAAQQKLKDAEDTAGDIESQLNAIVKRSNTNKN